MGGLRKLPIGIQDFESLRQDGYLYVDKTEIMYRPVSTGRYYFLSRPRRFGKSLLVSTMKAFFEGKRDLFEGLAIASKPDIDWAVHPVLHLDLNTQTYDSIEKLHNVLNTALSVGTAEEVLRRFPPRITSCLSPLTASRRCASASVSPKRPATSTRCWLGEFMLSL